MLIVLKALGRMPGFSGLQAVKLYFLNFFPKVKRFDKKNSKEYYRLVSCG